MVITTPDTATGFQLAGAETFSVDNPDQAEQILTRLLEGQEASLIVIRQDLLQAVSSRLQRRAEASYQPVVMAIPGVGPAIQANDRRQHISELIRRAIGFHITFGAELSPRGSEQHD